MLVRKHLEEKIRQVEAGDEVEIIWNDAVMISAPDESAFTDNPVLYEKARAVMKHRGIFLKFAELESGHVVMMLLLKRNSKVMMPRRNGLVEKKLNHPALLCIPVALISDLKIVRKSRGKTIGMMHVNIYGVDYNVVSLIPQRRIKVCRR